MSQYSTNPRIQEMAERLAEYFGDWHYRGYSAGDMLFRVKEELSNVDRFEADNVTPSVAFTDAEKVELFGAMYNNQNAKEGGMDMDSIQDIRVMMLACGVKELVLTITCPEENDPEYNETDPDEEE